MIQDISISLGACETNLLELTTAFATFANQGKPVWPYGITLIKNKAGEVLYRHESSEEKPIVSPQALSYMRELLRGVVATGSGRATNIDETVAGKTGSNGDRDAWFFGYREIPNDSTKAQGFTNVIVGVWVGNDDNKPMAKFSTGGRLPTQIAAAFLKGPHVEQKEKIEQKIKKLKESKNQTTTQVTLDQQLKGLL
jgi:penicillin-binding protein 1A